MSPVSRGRKPKKSKQKRPRRPVKAAQRPEWFEPAIEAVLDGTVALMSAKGPREVEQLTAELLGAQLHKAVMDEPGGLDFTLWFEDLVRATATRVRADGTAGPAFRLLHGLASISAPGMALSIADVCRPVWELGPDAPEWLTSLLDVTATGEVYRMRDAYGTRFGVIAHCSYGPEPFVCLLDIDTSTYVALAGAGVYDDVDQAAAAWLAAVGDAAGDTEPRPVRDPDELLCLVHLESGGNNVFGDEPRQVMDNWYRAPRRIDDIGEALDRWGTPLPRVESLFDVDATPMVEEFTSWLTGEPPDEVAELAQEWMGGALPETWYSVSPQRVEWQLELALDRGMDVSSMPDWVRWLAERSGLPAHLRDRVEKAAHHG